MPLRLLRLVPKNPDASENQNAQHGTSLARTALQIMYGMDEISRRNAAQFHALAL